MLHSMEPKPSSPDGTQTSPQPTGGGWIFPLLLAALLLGLVAVGKQIPKPTPPSQTRSSADWTLSPKPTGETVSLTIDFGNGAQKEFSALPYRAEMTVADLLAAARDFRPGITFTQVGTGESGFLRSLDGLTNQGAEGRNWLYQVDGKHAHASFCLEKLEPGRHILWKFTDELYNDDSK